MTKENVSMAKTDSTKSVDNALAHVNKGRRGFLKGMLIGSAALAVLPLMKSEALARQGDATGSGTPDDGKGKGKGGKGKGKGKGKGDGSGTGSAE
jgi:hypothetical protein